MSRIDLRPKHLIIVDAGHGVGTPGKRSPVWADGRQLLEWEFNRDLAGRIQKGLSNLGYDARLLVPEDDDLPLKARLRRATQMVEEHKGQGGIAPNRLLVSVHANASGTETPEMTPGGVSLGPSGWECFVVASSWNSRHVGELLLKHAKRLLPNQFPIRGAYGNLRHDGVRPDAKVGKYFIIQNAPCFAVLTENLFMDNRKDCDYLFTSEGRDTLAQLHIDAIVENFAHTTQ